MNIIMSIIIFISLFKFFENFFFGMNHNNNYYSNCLWVFKYHRPFLTELQPHSCTLKYTLPRSVAMHAFGAGFWRAFRHPLLLVLAAVSLFFLCDGQRRRGCNSTQQSWKRWPRSAREWSRWPRLSRVFPRVLYQRDRYVTTPFLWIIHAFCSSSNRKY